MWTLPYIFSQVFVVLAATFLASTYLIKKRELIFAITVGYSLCYAASYILLGAWIGVILNLVSIVRNIWFMIEFKKKGSISVFSLFSSMMLLVLSSTLNFVFISFHPIDLLILSETLVYTFSLWQKNNASFRWLALYSSACWLTYNIFVASLFAIIIESVVLVAKIVGVCLLYVKKKKNKNQISEKVDVEEGE